MGEKVLVYGSGGRDHALADEYIESPHVDKVFFAPGNPGINHTRKGQRGYIEQVPHVRDFEDVVRFCKDNEVGLVDVGSESPLSQGLVDVLHEAGLACVGPKREYTSIEGDRAFTNAILGKIGIKPEWRVFDPGPDATEKKRKEIAKEAKRYVRDVGYQVVVKAGGLGAGKSGFCCSNPREAEEAIDRIIVDREFAVHGPNSLRVIIEARKEHQEISFFAYLDGKTYLPLKMFAQDYKPAYDPYDALSMLYHRYGRNVRDIRRGLQENQVRIPENLEELSEGERDRILASLLKEENVRLANPNTGGTGCYCPHKLVEEEWVTNKILREVVNPFVNIVYNELGWDYRGVLYFGLNLNPDNSLSVFEVNVRHGDPEWEVIARKMKTDLFEIALATCKGRLDELKRDLPKGEVEWNSRHYVDVVAMVGRSRDPGGRWYPGYPGRYGSGYKITGLDEMDRGVVLFYSGVDDDPEKGLVTRGGRVLHVVAGGNSLEDARESAYKNIERLAFLDHRDNDENVLRYRKTIASATESQSF
jgi:phosphoribosylamine--glycine ligase